jgi:hypothetical protein
MDNHNKLVTALSLEKEVGRALNDLMPRLLTIAIDVCPDLRTQYLDGIIFKREFMNGVIESLSNSDTLYNYYLQCSNPDR